MDALEKKEGKTKRNKNLSKKKLLDAVGNIICRDGFQKIGINAIAKEAGLDKVLIYRYFGDLNGLLKEYVAQKDYWLSQAGLLKQVIQNTKPETLKEMTSKMFMGLYDALLKSREFQEITLWEMVERNELIDAFHRQRDEVTTALLKEYEQKFENTEVDLQAISVIISGGLYYMALQSRMNEEINGLNIKDKEGLERIEKSIRLMIDLVLTEAENKKK